MVFIRFREVNILLLPYLVTRSVYLDDTQPSPYLLHSLQPHNITHLYRIRHRPTGSGQLGQLGLLWGIIILFISFSCNTFLKFYFFTFICEGIFICCCLSVREIVRFQGNYIDNVFFFNIVC